MQDPEYYTAIEFHPLYTVYAKVPVEECGSDFLSSDELFRQDYSWVYMAGHNNAYLVCNQQALTDVVNSAIETFKNRNTKYKRVGFDHDFGRDEVIHKFRTRLENVGLKWTTKRLYEAKPKPVFVKGSVRSAFFDLVERNIQEAFEDLTIEIKHKNEKENQRKLIRGVVNQLGMTFDSIWASLSTKELWWRTDGLKVEGVKEYLKEYWDECLNYDETKKTEEVDSNE